MKSKLIGREVKIIKCKYGHCFKIGDTAIIIGYDKLINDYKAKVDNSIYRIREDEFIILNT